MESLLWALGAGYIMPLFVGDESGDPDDQANPLLVLFCYVLGALILGWVLLIGGAWVLAKGNVVERILKPITDFVGRIIDGVISYISELVKLVVSLVTFGAV